MKYSRLEAKDYARAHLRGIWAAPLNPMHSDFSIDEEGLRANIRHWIDDLDIDGMCACSKLGECGSLSLAELKRVAEIIIEECGGDTGTAVTCMDQNPDTVLELARHAQDAGADFIVIHTPVLPLVVERCETVRVYFEYLCSKLDIGVIVWSHPDAGYVLSPESCVELARIPNIVGFKYSGPRPMYAALTRMAGENFVVTCGSETEWLQNITELGWQLYFSNSWPYLMQTRNDRRIREYTDFAMRGEVEKAREIHGSLEQVRQALRSSRPSGKPHAHQKYWLELLGLAGGHVRRPMLDLNEPEKAKVREAFEDCGLQP